MNISIAETFLSKWRSWVSRSRRPEIIKLGKTKKKHIDSMLEAIRPGINSTVVIGLNN